MTHYIWMVITLQLQKKRRSWSIHKKSLQHKYLPPLSKSIDKCTEIVTAEVKLRNGKRIIICCIYRAPNTDLTLLNEHINLIFSYSPAKTVYLCGDFNVDLNMLMQIILLISYTVLGYIH